MVSSKLGKHKTMILLGVILAFTVFQTFCQGTQASKPKGKTGASADTKTNSAATPTTPALKAVQQKLVVYYFYTTYRCHSCTMIEKLTKTAVEAGFKDLLASGRVEFKGINIEQPGNEHFVEDYKLYTKSVILSDLRDGKEAKWKNLDQVWTLLGNEGKFIEYIQKEIKTYLEG
ncbi:MAG: hypothetical protein GX556_08470 [Fibrobacter sp.]|nr:hypothetical protein [Fibrobacter sp.]